MFHSWAPNLNPAAGGAGFGFGFSQATNAAGGKAFAGGGLATTPGLAFAAVAMGALTFGTTALGTGTVAFPGTVPGALPGGKRRVVLGAMLIQAVKQQGIE